MFTKLTKNGITRALTEAKFKKFVKTLKKAHVKVNSSDVDAYIKRIPNDELYTDRRIVFKNLCTLLR